MSETTQDRAAEIAARWPRENGTDPLHTALRSQARVERAFLRDDDAAERRNEVYRDAAASRVRDDVWWLLDALAAERARAEHLAGLLHELTTVRVKEVTYSEGDPVRARLASDVFPSIAAAVASAFFEAGGVNVVEWTMGGVPNLPREIFTVTIQRALHLTPMQLHAAAVARAERAEALIDTIRRYCASDDSIGAIDDVVRAINAYDSEEAPIAPRPASANAPEHAQPEPGL